MGNWRGNRFSHWLCDEFFEQWAAGMALPVTDDKPCYGWVDIETTGLSKNHDLILNLGIVLTNEIGEVCRDGAIDWLVFPSEDAPASYARRVLSNMDEYVKNMHTKSGLLRELEAAQNIDVTGDMDPARVSADATLWLTDRCGAPDPNAKLMVQFSGSSAHFDRGFIENQMPVLNSWFHYRNGVDISGIREVARRVNPSVLESQPSKLEKHRPLPDLADSIRLYRHILTNFLMLDNKTYFKMQGVLK